MGGMSDLSLVLGPLSVVRGLAPRGVVGYFQFSSPLADGPRTVQHLRRQSGEHKERREQASLEANNVWCGMDCARPVFFVVKAGRPRLARKFFAGP